MGWFLWFERCTSVFNLSSPLHRNSLARAMQAHRHHPNPVPGETAPGRFRSVRGTDRPETSEDEGLMIGLRTNGVKVTIPPPVRVERSRDTFPPSRVSRLRSRRTVSINIRHCERSEAIQGVLSLWSAFAALDCRVAPLLAMTVALSPPHDLYKLYTVIDLFHSPPRLPHPARIPPSPARGMPAR